VCAYEEEVRSKEARKQTTNKREDPPFVQKGAQRMGHPQALMFGGGTETAGIKSQRYMKEKAEILVW